MLLNNWGQTLGSGGKRGMWFRWGAGGGGRLGCCFRLGRRRAKGHGGRELNGFFLQIEFRFTNGLGRTLALQNFRITHLIHAEILAKVCTTGNKNNVDKTILM